MKWDILRKFTAITVGIVLTIFILVPGVLSVEAVAPSCCAYQAIGDDDVLHCLMGTGMEADRQREADNCARVYGVFLPTCPPSSGCASSGTIPIGDSSSTSISTTPSSGSTASSTPNTLKGISGLKARLKNAAEQGVGFSTPSSPVEVAGRITRGALVVIGLVFFTILVYGGFLRLTASSNEERVKSSNSIITRAIIGILIVLFAGVIAQFITYYGARSVTTQTSGEGLVITP